MPPYCTASGEPSESEPAYRLVVVAFVVVELVSVSSVNERAEAESVPVTMRFVVVAFEAEKEFVVSDEALIAVLVIVPPLMAGLMMVVPES